MPSNLKDDLKPKVIHLVPRPPGDSKEDDKKLEQQMELETDMDALEALLIPLELLAERMATAIYKIGNNKEKEGCQTFLRRLSLAVDSFDDLWQIMVIDNSE